MHSDGRVDIATLEGTDIKVARTFNWTGHMLCGPWSQLDKILSNIGDERPGIIICDASKSGAEVLAVRGSYNVAAKIQELDGKAAWHQVFAAMPQEWELTSPQLRYIEQRLAEIIYFGGGDIEPKAGLFQQWPDLSEAQQANAEQFVAYTRLLTRGLGGEFLESSQRQTDEHDAASPKM